MRGWMVAVCLTALLVAPGQTLGQARRQTEEQAPTLHIGVTAVEIDAVVTDGSGRHVPDLNAGDFELLQDGKPQTITGFRFVAPRSRPAGSEASGKPIVPSHTAAPAAPLAPGSQLRRDQATRIMAIVVDDLNIGYNNMTRLRRALDDFIEHDMRSDDAIAILTTSRGVGRLQQFTNDKTVLKQIVAGLRIDLLGLGAGSQEGENAERLTDSTGDRSSLDVTDAANKAQQDAANDAIQEDLQTGSLAAVQNVVRGMRDLPGRKSVLFASDGLALMQQAANGPKGTVDARPKLWEAFQRLIDESNRSFVVINTYDTRGVTNPLATTFNVERYNTAPRHQDITNDAEQSANMQGGQRELARLAGGLFFAGNDPGVAVNKALADQEGYYVLGYQPDASTFKRTEDKRVEFHSISVRVKRPGLQARTRSGFFGMTDAEAHPEPRSDEERLWNVATSPFIANDLGVRVTPIFAHRKSGDIFKVLLHVDGAGLTFTKAADGRYQAPLQILATLIDSRGAAVEGQMFRFNLQTGSEPDAAARAEGFSCNIDLRATRPGAYQLRVAARDVGSSRTGTGYQFVRVPNLATARLALSGIALQGDNAGSGPAERRFKPASTLRYAFAAYNAQVNPQSHQPALTLRLRLYRDGVLLVDGKPVPVEALSNQEDPERTAEVAGELQLSPAIKPGEYQLQVEVQDTHAPAKTSTARQWIDFTIAGAP